MQVVEQIILDNEIYKNKFKQNKLFQTLPERLLKDPNLKEKFLNYFQIWSDEFQKMVLARIVFSEKREFIELAGQHLQEEFGHNTQLLKKRKNFTRVEDPILEALSSWFTSKMLTLGDAEKTVLIHLVIEACADIFYKSLADIFKDNNETLEHFECHHSLDTEHEQMGINLLKSLDTVDNSLILIQKKGWTMINALFNRLAEICEEAP